METERYPRSAEEWAAVARRLRRQYLAARTPTTFAVLLVVAVVFAGQSLGALFTPAPSVRALTAVLYLNGGPAVYLLSPFLHRGVPHFLANVVVLLALAPQERHFSPAGYWTFLLGTLCCSLAAGYAVLSAFAVEPRVAFYGISGLGYALGGFALTRTLREPAGTAEVDLLACVVGVSSVVGVAANLAVNLPATPVAVNGGHLAGLLVGLAVGAAGGPLLERA